MTINEDTVAHFVDKRLDAVEEKITSILESYWPLVEKLEQRLESLEAIVAQLIPAFGELAANDEAILNILAKASPEERMELQAALAESRRGIIEALSYATKSPEVETPEE